VVSQYKYAYAEKLYDLPFIILHLRIGKGFKEWKTRGVRMKGETVNMGWEYRMGVDTLLLDDQVPEGDIAHIEKLELPQDVASKLYEPRYWTWKRFTGTCYWYNRMGAVIREFKNGGHEPIKEYFAKEKGRYVNIYGKRHYVSEMLSQFAVN